MAREDDLDRWEAEGTPIAEMRGVVSFDYNNSLILVRAGVAEVAQAFAEMRDARLLRSDVAEDEVQLARQCFFIFRLKGHAWTEILDKELMEDDLDDADAQALSRRFQTQALHYGVSDTALALGYKLYDKGELVEELFTDDGMMPVQFESRTHNISIDDIDDVEEWAHNLFKELDALEPGIRFAYIVGHVASQEGETISLTGMSEDFEQVAYVAL